MTSKRISLYVLFGTARNTYAAMKESILRAPVRALFFFLVCFVITFSIKLDYKGSLGGDALSYVRCAYHLVHNGMYSDTPNKHTPEPFARRAPGYSFFLAGCIQTLPSLSVDSFDSLFPQDGTPPKPSPNLYWIKWVQALLLLATALLTAWLVWEFTKAPLVSYLTLWIIAFHPFLERYVDRLYRETLGAFLIILFATLIYLAIKKRSLLLHCFAGLTLGFTTLTFAQWKYIGAVYIAILFLHGVFFSKHKARLTLCTILLALSWVSVFTPWEMRNKSLFGESFISAGGGVVLETRALYNTMPASAYWSSFAYWSRSPIFKKALTTFIDKDNYIFLLRDDPKGMYHRAKVEWTDLRNEIGTVPANTQLTQQALKKIKQHPIRHLAMCLPVSFRLMMNPALSVLYIPVYVFFFYGVYVAVRSKKWSLCLILTPTVGLFAFNTLTTHGLTRYNEVATPILILGALLGYIFFTKRDHPPLLTSS